MAISLSSTPQFRSIPLSDLEFDPLNPRLPSDIDSQDLRSVLEFMLDDAGLLDLMGSIAKQGFFPGEPILVSPGSGDKWCVVEGNRRFASALLLQEPGLAPTSKRQVKELALEAKSADSFVDKLPTLVFAQREMILSHLGYRHVTGIKEWDPLAKARFLSQRFAYEDGDNVDRFRSLARSIGSRSDYVGRLLTSLALYHIMESNSFFGISGLNAATIDFSLITSVLAYTNVVAYLGLSSSQDMDVANINRERLEFLTRFVFEKIEGRTRLGESRNIRVLADVLDTPKALRALENGASLRAASQLTDAGAQAFRTLVSSAKESIELAFDVLGETSIGNDDVLLVGELQQAAQSLSSAVDIRFALRS